MWKKETLEKRLAKVGLRDGSISANGKFKLRLSVGGSTAGPGRYCIITLDNLRDPNNPIYDHFTSIFPATIRKAIEWMAKY